MMIVVVVVVDCSDCLKKNIKKSGKAAEEEVRVAIVEEELR